MRYPKEKGFYFYKKDYFSSISRIFYHTYIGSTYYDIFLGFFFHRHLSESESSLEMEEERVYNELSHASGAGGSVNLTTPSAAGVSVHRTRTVSSPVPVMPGPSPQGIHLESNLLVLL